MVPELSIFIVAECLRNLGTAKHHCQEVREHRYEHLKHTLKLLWGRGRDRVICRSFLSFESKGCELQYFVSLGKKARNSTTSMLIPKLLFSIQSE